MARNIANVWSFESPPSNQEYYAGIMISLENIYVTEHSIQKAYFSGICRIDICSSGSLCNVYMRIKLSHQWIR